MVEALRSTFGGYAPPVEILVCQAGACRSAGSEAVLLEIEELAKGLGRCNVQPSGCLGACDQAPNAIIIRQRRELLCTHIRDAERSAAVVQQATGKAPNLDDPVVLQRLDNARKMRIRKQAREENKWNAALAGLADQVLSASGNQRLELQLEHSELLTCAGSWERALDILTEVESVMPGNIEVLMERAKVLGKLGLVEEIDTIQQQVARRLTDTDNCRLEIQVTSFLAKCKASKTVTDASQRPIENYARWHLEGITKVSKHSAIYHFTSKDKARGTPNPRGRGRTVWHKTWHTTLLAHVGANDEGPLPWIERDYTPISSAKEWEQGRCDILIKIYSTGRATSWLHKQQIGSDILLSQPKKTLDVPSLVPDLREAAFKPASVLLVLAGTGIVAAPQVLQHLDPVVALGVPTQVLKVPISLIYSCRKDDALMTTELLGWCRANKLQRCSLALTEPQAGVVLPFPDVNDAGLDELASLANVSVEVARVSPELLERDLQTLPSPCRIVVSGPVPFNSAVKDALTQIGVGSEAVTILSA
eukprot:CAMPEP_0179099894 /NCGR_PEP_ID=MMETSP0796-20121207/46105_1 /TAXON_ID=73915 /ORGANISM="Pyrodinium bahamense, Strain pbaha01" /LENGTH=533 /DNA_ID=CAMNT_0020797699 /DNA_START=58 /DNA_END=1659 /DNA_ORIENTATION=+